MVQPLVVNSTTSSATNSNTGSSSPLLSDNKKISSISEEVKNSIPNHEHPNSAVPKCICFEAQKWQELQNQLQELSQRISQVEKPKKNAEKFESFKNEIATGLSKTLQAMSQAQPVTLSIKALPLSNEEIKRIRDEGKKEEEAKAEAEKAERKKVKLGHLETFHKLRSEIQRLHEEYKSFTDENKIKDCIVKLIEYSLSLETQHKNFIKKKLDKSTENDKYKKLNLTSSDVEFIAKRTEANKHKFENLHTPPLNLVNLTTDYKNTLNMLKTMQEHVKYYNSPILAQASEKVDNLLPSHEHENAIAAIGILRDAIDGIGKFSDAVRLERIEIVNSKKLPELGNFLQKINRGNLEAKDTKEKYPKYDDLSDYHFALLKFLDGITQKLHKEDGSPKDPVLSEFQKDWLKIAVTKRRNDLISQIKEIKTDLHKQWEVEAGFLAKKFSDSSDGLRNEVNYLGYINDTQSTATGKSTAIATVNSGTAKYKKESIFDEKLRPSEKYKPLKTYSQEELENKFREFREKEAAKKTSSV